MSGSKADQPASAKKLKQACLPFKLVNSPGTDGGAKGRKRKLSGTENDEVRVENRQVEPVNGGGGAKRFIKSDDEDAKESSRVSESPTLWAVFVYTNRSLVVSAIRRVLNRNVRVGGPMLCI